MDNLIEVLKWKFPGVPIVVNGGKVVEWGSADKIPSDEEIEVYRKEHAAYVEENAYRPKRAAEYPPVGDQLDAIWRFFDGMDLSGAEKEFKDVYDAVKAVKEKYPKPEDKTS